MDIRTPIMFENIKIEADSDCAFFGLAAAADGSASANASNDLGGFSGPSDAKLSALLSSASPFTIAGVGTSCPLSSQSSVAHVNPSEAGDFLGEALFSSDIAEQLELDLPEFTCDFGLLENDGFMDTTSSLLREDSDSKDSETSSSPDAYLGSPPLDTPPLTPPSPVVKMETELKSPSPLDSVPPNVLPILKNLPPGTNLTKILPALKTSRGRSASHDSPDVQALKRHIRMIRNRESASLSRKKKKEYVTSLEDRIRELEKENTQLKQENQLLKSRLHMHQQSTIVSQTTGQKCNGNSATNGGRTVPNANRTKLIAKVALLGVCCFMVLSAHAPKNYYTRTDAISNVSTESKVLQSYGAHPDLPRHLTEFPHLRLSRSMAWHDDFKETRHKSLDFQEQNKIIKGNSTVQAKTLGQNNGTRPVSSTYTQSRRRAIKQSYSNASLPLPQPNELTDLPVKSNCKTFFNQTESLRVQNDLKGLFSRGKPKRKSQQQQPKPFLYSLMDVNSAVDNNKGLTVYDQRMQRYTSFLDKIKLREDTFYVVSLAMDDQLLLSAKSSNASSRPKMSFLMPWRNDSLGGKEEVMQIDCEVTKVFNLKNLRKNAPTQ